MKFNRELNSLAVTKSKILLVAFSAILILASCSAVPADGSAETQSATTKQNESDQPDISKSTTATEQAVESSAAEEKPSEAVNISNEDTNIIKLNRANESFVVTDGTWVYYPNAKDAFSLYRTKPDGSENVKLNSEESTWLNLKDGWIYYSCFNAGPDNPSYGIYKIKTDGTEKTKLSDEHAVNLMLEEDWLYYKKFNPTGKGEIYRMKLDGSSSQKLNDIDSWHSVITDGWIYYSGNMSKFYKMKPDGSGNTLISKDAANHINVAGDWIYYSLPYDRGQICKSKTDGTEGTKIGTARTSYGMLVLDDWIYYIYNADKKLYKIRPDGTDNTKVLSEGLLQKINYLDGWIYYREMSPPYLLYQVKPDGTGLRAVE